MNKKGAREDCVRLCLEPERFALCETALAPSVSAISSPSFPEGYRSRVLLPESFIRASGAGFAPSVPSMPPGLSPALVEFTAVILRCTHGKVKHLHERRVVSRSGGAKNIGECGSRGFHTPQVIRSVTGLLVMFLEWRSFGLLSQ